MAFNKPLYVSQYTRIIDEGETIAISIFSSISGAFKAFNREATVTLSLRFLIRIGI